MTTKLQGSLVVHYGEIGTKGNNRPFFENQLQRNIREKVQPLGVFEVKLHDQRFILSAENHEALLRAVPILKDIFGVVWLAQVFESPLDYPNAREAAVEQLLELKASTDAVSFRVTAKRANKKFGLSSQEMAIRLGEDIVKETGLQVDLSNPQITLFVDILSDRILSYTSKTRGPGGLPVGTTGKVIHLLSGGIDSPVAAWLMMKRGCDPTYLHFFVAPSAQQILETKISSLLQTLTKYGTGHGRIVLVPFSPYQIATADLRQDYEPVVFRHFMRIVSEKIANLLDATAISTGDNLGQVASQTLHNLACIDAGTGMPIMRPLLGYDKSEIVGLAERIGTYHDSIADYKDCCSIISRHPKTRMNLEHVLEASRRYEFPSLAEEVLSKASLMRFDPTTGKSSVEPLERAAMVENA